MSRIRWYHYYFILALFDVLVIMVSLHLHNETLGSVSDLIREEVRLDDQSRCLQRTQQRVLELALPGKELLRARSADEVVWHRRRFELAKGNLETTLNAASSLGLDVVTIQEAGDAMLLVSAELFALFETGQIAAADRPVRLEAASSKLADLDQRQHDALRGLAGLFARNASARHQLVQSHEANLQARVNYERYFIAAVILILLGVLAFGRRLQQTDRALAEERLRVEAERRESLAAIGELCSSVAHGIRNPLAAIQSSAALSLELGQLDDSSRERITDIMDEGRRLGDRVTGLLGMARAGREGFGTVDLNEVVCSAIRELKPRFDELGKAVKADVAHKPLIAAGDPRQLEQAVIELLSNAMEHSVPGAAIRVACHRKHSNGQAAIVVENRGANIPDELKERVFDLFFTTRPTGTGIGLASVRRTAEIHGGAISLTDADTGGARFELTLPVSDARV